MADQYRDNNILGAKTERAADKALGSHDEPRTTGDVVGESVGGLSGAATGAALGSLGGPIGTIIGGIAGAATGWWSGRAISEAASSFDQDEDYYRGHYQSRTGATGTGATGTGATGMGASAGATNTADVSRRHAYDHARPAYQLGHLAGLNPDYQGRQFDDVEPDLRRGYDSYAGSDERPAWNDVRDYARDAYTSRPGATGSGADARMQLQVASGTVSAGEVGYAHAGGPRSRCAGAGECATTRGLDESGGPMSASDAAGRGTSRSAGESSGCPLTT
jgi:hypothetical protein